MNIVNLVPVLAEFSALLIISTTDKSTGVILSLSEWSWTTLSFPNRNSYRVFISSSDIDLIVGSGMILLPVNAKKRPVWYIS